MGLHHVVLLYKYYDETAAEGSYTSHECLGYCISSFMMIEFIHEYSTQRFVAFTYRRLGFSAEIKHYHTQLLLK